MVCAKCDQEFVNADETAQCTMCQKEFHAGCCRLRTLKKLQGMKASKGDTWRCDNCAVDMPSPASEVSPNMHDILMGIKNELTQLRSENKTNFDTLNASITSLHTSLEDVKARLVVVETEKVELRKECDDLRDRNNRLFDRVSSLEGEMIDLQQYSRINNLEIRGIPLTTGEDIYEILQSLAHAINVPFVRDSISVAHRIGKYSNIIVRFVSRTTRATWVAAAKRKKVQTTDLKASMTQAPVYVGEHLTAHNKAVLGQARQLVRMGRLAFAWAQDGKILVRRTPGERAVRIWYTDDAQQIALPNRTSADSESILGRHDIVD